MDPHYILAECHRSDYPLRKIAKDLEVTPGAVTLVVKGERTSYNIASYISAKTKIPLNRLWPDGRYSKPPAYKSKLKSKVVAKAVAA